MEFSRKAMIKVLAKFGKIQSKANPFYDVGILECKENTLKFSYVGNNYHYVFAMGCTGNLEKTVIDLASFKKLLPLSKNKMARIENGILDSLYHIKSDLDISKIPEIREAIFSSHKELTIKKDEYLHLSKFVSDNTLRPFMCGIHIHRNLSEGVNCNLVATNVYSMVVKPEFIDRMCPDISVVLPIIPVISDITLKIGDTMTECTQIFEGTYIKYTVKHIDEQFPNYNRVIPATETMSQLQFNGKHFLDALHVLKPLVDKKSKVIDLEFIDSTIILSVGDTKIPVVSEFFIKNENHSNKFRFNIDYLIPCIKPDTLNYFHYSESNRAVIISSNDNCLRVVMGMIID